MKSKVFSLAMLLVVGVSALFMFSACGKKKYDLKLSYDSLPDHVTSVYVEGYKGEDGKYIKGEDLIIVAECEVGYEPKFTLSLGEQKVEAFSSYSCLNADSAEVEDYKFAYKFKLSAEGLTGAQTVSIEASEAKAVYDLKFTMDGTFDKNDSKFAGLKFVFKGLVGGDVTLTVQELADMIKDGKTLKYESGENIICEISADNDIVGTDFFVEASDGITSSRTKDVEITFTPVAEAVIKFIPAEFKLK